MITFDDINIGDFLPVLSTEKISRTTLALYAGASGDYNPIHIDIDFAKSAGMDDVFAHGMLSMAYLGRLLTNWVDQRKIQKIDVRFTAITPLFAQMVCTGLVQKKDVLDGESIIEVLVEAKDSNSGEVKLSGIATINLTEHQHNEA